jgi:cytochrome c oxidase subunit 2
MKPRRRFAIRSRAMAPLAALFAVALGGCRQGPPPPMDTLAPKSNLAQWIYSLFLEVTAWDAAIMLIVVAAFVLAVFFFSSRAEEGKPASSTASNLGLEIAWTVGPLLVIIMITIPTVRLIFRSQPSKAPAHALTVNVLAHQWWWEFDYGDGSGIKTANEMHIPAGRPIQLLLRSADVIHSFWVPELGGKRDVIPGQVNELMMIANVPGYYYGQCAEFCGLSHANMRFRVIVEPKQAFARWEKEQEAPPVFPKPGTVASKGAAIFDDSPCTTCHTIAGVSKGYIGPDLTHFASRTTLAAGVLKNTRANVEKWITNPDKVKPGAHMPALGLSRVQASDLAAYLESLK